MTIECDGVVRTEGALCEVGAVFGGEVFVVVAGFLVLELLHDLFGGCSGYVAFDMDGGEFLLCFGLGE